MARTVGSHGPTTLSAIREAGLDLIYKHGYEAMSLRSLAAAVGIQVGSLYNHISNKQDLLFDLLKTHMRTLLDHLHEALDPVAGAENRLREFVKFHIAYHLRCRREVHISYYELRSLSPEHYQAIVGMRREYEAYLISIIRDGMAERCFSVDNAPAVSYGIIALLTGVLGWFDPDGRMTTEALVAVNTRMVLGAVGAGGPEEAPPGPEVAGAAG